MTDPKSPTKHAPLNPGIQGLRALAVLLVVVGHSFPELIPGGYVGVDVFFVISGYLITSSLLRELGRSDTISLPAFYTRRIRRLLPASTVLLIFVALTLPFYPATHWEEIGQQLFSCAAYFQNWWLAFNAVDYLASEEAPTPLQHFWSLAVEEQFYFVWPLVLVAAHKLSGGKKGGSLPLLLTLFFSSFAYSLYLSYNDPAWAYFSSLVRAWELAAGGLLAYAQARWSGRLPRGKWLELTGLSLVLVASFALNEQSRFPGWAALLPVVGATLMLTHCIEGKSLLSSQPLVRLGDQSYSLYLWHWPLLILVESNVGEKNLVWAKMGAILISVVIAEMSRALIEDPFRRASWYRARPAFISALASIGVFWGSARYISNDVEQQSQVQLSPENIELAAAAAKKDKPDVYDSGCHRPIPAKTLKECAFGKKKAAKTMVLYGDSHAVQWLPPLEKIASDLDYRLELHTKSGCSPQRSTPQFKKRPYRECIQWRKRARDAIVRGKPEVVVMAGSQRRGDKKFVEGSLDGDLKQLHSTVAPFREAGIQVVFISDTQFVKDVPHCLSKHPHETPRCLGTLGNKRHDVYRLYAEKHQDVHFIDMLPTLCPQNQCPPIADGMITRRDAHHLTATYASHLAPVLKKKLSEHLGN